MQSGPILSEPGLPLAVLSVNESVPPVQVQDRRAGSDGLALWVLVGIVTLTFGWILLPFYGTLLWSAIIAMVFAPVNARMLVWAKGRKTLAAFGTLLSVIILVMLPFALITVAVVNETSQVYQQLQSGEINPERFFGSAFSSLPDWFVSLLGRF